MRLVAKEWLDDLGYHVGIAMGQILHDHQDHQDQEHQQPREWQSHDVDGYRFSIRRDSMGNLEVQREETP